MTAPSSPVLTIDQLTVTLPLGADRPHAIADISLTLSAGETLCVIGESGSGKSVTAQAVMGLLPPPLRPVGGRILFEGSNLLELGPEALRTLRGRRIAMVFQEAAAALDPLMSVGDQLAEAILAHESVPRRELERRVVEQLASVNLPDPANLRHAFPHRLSGGQQQRVMIATALAMRPAVLIADEPTTALDVTTQAQVLKLLAQLRAQHGTALMFVTHDFGVVAEIADRIVVMRQGVVVEQGSAHDILRHPHADYTKKLIAAVPTLDAPARPAASGAALLTVSGLRKTYARRRGLFRRAAPVPAVDDVGFVLGKGETLGIVGESGSGKSTLARCVIGLVRPEAGTIEIAGLPLARPDRPRSAEQIRQLQMVFQDPFASLNPRQTIGAIVEAPLLVNGAAPAAARARAVELLDLVGIGAKALERYPHEFSGGQRQRISIARALMLSPQILIADEAVSSLDVSIQAVVLDLLADIKARLGLSMLFITHDLRVAARICDRVLVMRAGRVVEHGPVAKVFGAPEHDYTRTLLAAVPGQAWLAERGAP